MRLHRYHFVLVLALLLSLNIPTFSQSLEFTKTPNGPVNFDLDVDVAKINLHVKNISSSPVRVWVTMDTSQISPSHRSYYCWEQCYSFGVVDARDIVGGKPITLQPGQDTNAFTAYVDHYAVFDEPTAGVSTLGFDFFNEEDPSDRISISLTFNVGSATSIQESKIIEKQAIFWNTTTQSMSIDPKLTDADIVLTSINGSRIQYAEHNAHALSSGIYGYSITEKTGKIHRGYLSIIR
jgi:hypothetical protein